jgi:choline dehydrogenase-like flavoprotein
MADIEADVIIVGSGISGALLAAKLAGHIMGTARMGDNAKASVIDRNSSQPRSPQSLHPRLDPATANPTLTIAALALRAAGRVKAALTQ